jgi:hypothetical protein
MCFPLEEGQKNFNVNKQTFKFRGENKVKANFIRIEHWDGNWILLFITGSNGSSFRKNN